MVFPRAMFGVIVYNGNTRGLRTRQTQIGVYVWKPKRESELWVRRILYGMKIFVKYKCSYDIRFICRRYHKM